MGGGKKMLKNQINSNIPPLPSNVYSSNNSVSSMTLRSLCAVSNKVLFILFICVICEKKIDE